MKVFALFTLALICIAFSQSFPLRREKRELYHAYDNVELLTRDNFYQQIEGSSHAWIVEFYASWCGDCQRFLPIWQKFAIDVYPWKDLVRVAVLECSDEYNTEICRNLGIVRYPTLRYFHENYHFTNNSGAEIKETDETVPDLRHYLLDQIETELSEGRGRIYPNLSPYDTNTTDLFASESNDTQFVFLVIDQANSYLGREIALDLHKTPNISIRYGDENSTDLPIKTAPSVLVFDRSGKAAILPGETTTRAQIKAAIGNFLSENNIQLIEDVPLQRDAFVDEDASVKERKVARSKLREHVKKMGDVVFQKDLEAALRYSLKQEVGTVKSIKGEQLQALKDYIAVVKKYFPFGLDKDLFLNEISGLVANSDEANGEEIAAIVRKYEGNNTRLFSSPQGYLACEGSSGRYRGYPCSLWKMFHYLTVNAAVYNYNNRRAKPLEILAPMHGYIKHFFSCRSCSKHFQAMALERNMTSVTSLDNSIMWLWAAHNQVNRRLSGDPTEDPEYPKLQYPNKVRCPRCYNEDESWNEKEVFTYLKNVYSKYNIRYIGSDTKSLFNALD